MPPLVSGEGRTGSDAKPPPAGGEMDPDSDDEPPSLESDEEADIPVFTNAKREDVRNHARFARPDLVAMSQQGGSSRHAATCSILHGFLPPA